jgi:hypothetical protein
LSAYVNGEQVWPVPLALIVLLGVSYFTRPPSRRLAAALR